MKVSCYCCSFSEPANILSVPHTMLVPGTEDIIPFLIKDLLTKI